MSAIADRTGQWTRRYSLVDRDDSVGSRLACLTLRTQPESDSIGARRATATVVRHCNVCRKAYFYPRDICPACFRGTPLDKVERTRLVVQLRHRASAAQRRLARIGALRRRDRGLEEGVRCRPTDRCRADHEVSCGMPVTVKFKAVSAGFHSCLDRSLPSDDAVASYCAISNASVRIFSPRRRNHSRSASQTRQTPEQRRDGSDDRVPLRARRSICVAAAYGSQIPPAGS